MKKNIQKVVLAGGGVLGSQIAFQAAYCGFDVTVWLRSEESIKRCKTKIDELKKTYASAVKNMAAKKEWCLGIAAPKAFNQKQCLKNIAKAQDLIKFEIDKTKAFADADLVIEALRENLDDKKVFLKDIEQYLPAKTIIVTNSSTLLPSAMVSAVKRKNQFLSLHFANAIWKNNTAEVMAQKYTDEASFKAVVKFAEDIKMIALPIKKEKSGYLLNSMLVPFLLSAFDLYANGISDFKSIDKAWMAGTGAPKGPFMIMDVAGFETVKNIVLQYQKVPKMLNPLLGKMMLPYNYKGMLKIINQYISEGKKGFYS